MSSKPRWRDETAPESVLVIHSCAHSVLAIGFRRPHEQGFLASAFSGWAALEHIDDPNDAIARLRRRSPDLIVLSDCDAHHTPFLPLAERLRLVAPAIPLLVALGPYRDAPRTTTQFARLGSHLVYAQNPAELRATCEQVLECAATRTGVTELFVALEHCTAPGGLHHFMRDILCHVHSAHNVVDLADQLHVSRRTLSRLARTAGWPPPGELLDWARILCATTLPEGKSAVRRERARAMGLGSDRGLQAISRRLVRMRVDLRAANARDVIICALERRINAQPPNFTLSTGASSKVGTRA